MSILHNLISLMILTACVFAEDSVSLDSFSKLSLEERDKIIKSSPEKDRAVLSKTSGRLLMKENYIKSLGPEAWRCREEERALANRGFDGNLLGVFVTRLQMVEAYYSSVIDASKKSGASRAQLETIDQQASAEQAAASEHHWKVIHPHVVTLCATSAALDLEKSARDLSAEWESYSQSATRRVIRSEFEKLCKKTQAIDNKMEGLPRLTAKQMQAEIDSLPEEEPHR